MGVAVAAGLLGFVVVLVALLHDATTVPASPRAPDWAPLPDPADLRRFEFPPALSGYDPASVELAFEALSRAYLDLRAVAPPRVVARARRRAERRARWEHGAVPASQAPLEVFDVPAEDDALEAMRTTAALAVLHGDRTECLVSSLQHGPDLERPVSE